MVTPTPAPETPAEKRARVVAALREICWSEQEMDRPDSADALREAADMLEADAERERAAGAALDEFAGYLDDFGSMSTEAMVAKHGDVPMEGYNNIPRRFLQMASKVRAALHAPPGGEANG